MLQDKIDVMAQDLTRGFIRGLEGVIRKEIKEKIGWDILGHESQKLFDSFLDSVSVSVKLMHLDRLEKKVIDSIEKEER